MLVPGLVSITFRSLAPSEIIRLACAAGLQAIEWGGDVHVPPGKVEHAREIGRRTREAGLMVAAYGSYYRLGGSDAAAAPFEDVLASAVGLGAPTIRVWAGSKGSSDYSPEERRGIIDDGFRIAEMAASAGMTVSLEYHAGTLTDTRASVQSLLAELAHPNIEFLWQPSNGESVEDCSVRLLDVLRRLRNVHVFHWWPTHYDRRALADGDLAWRSYIEIVRQTDKPVDFLLEYVAGDAPEQLLADAATLRRFLAMH